MGGGGEWQREGRKGREGERENLKQALAQPDLGLDLTAVRSPPEPKSRFGYLTNRATPKI